MADDLNLALKNLGVSINVLSSGKVSKPIINGQRAALKSIFAIINTHLKTLNGSLAAHSKNPSANTSTLRSVLLKLLQDLDKIRVSMKELKIDTHTNPHLCELRDFLIDLERIIGNFASILSKEKDLVKLGQEIMVLSQEVSVYNSKIGAIVKDRMDQLDSLWTTAPAYL